MKFDFVGRDEGFLWLGTTMKPSLDLGGGGMSGSQRSRGY